MMFTQNLLLTYGIFLIAGAFFGLKAGSRVSLIMGIISGVFILGSYALTFNDPGYGYLCAALISGVLSAVFLARVVKTRKFMPAGMLLAFSVLILISVVLQLVKP